ncbi:MAG: flagellar biosynthesis protein FlhB [Phycisphaerales bacterium]|nr:MAG: flagellar biosynthesis protein FlhB [Phycisphaerales bacterium]
MGERTESPTTKRLSEARERGQVARSQDLASAFLLLGALIVLATLGAGLLERMAALLRETLQTWIVLAAAPDATPVESLVVSLRHIAWMLAPILALMTVIAYVSHVVQIGWLVSVKALQPKLEKFNLVKGLGKMVSRRNWVKGGVNIMKLAAVTGIASLVIKGDYAQVITLPLLTAQGAFALVGQMVVKLALWLLLALIFIGVIDFLYQRWQHSHDLRMHKHEVKDERRSTEGDPLIRARRLRMAREIAMQRLRADVPKADVVVTNPTHFAVAIKYDESFMRAPRVVAKGADFLALQIRQLAAANGVPIIERPSLARALYRNVEVGREIPQEQYEAVAEVLAYVYRLDGRAAS